MLDGKLRIAPTCYHVLHLLPVMAAHEMNFFYDAGLKTADGRLGIRSCATRWCRLAWRNWASPKR